MKWKQGGERKKYLTAHNFVKFRRNKFNLPFIFNNTSVLIVPIIYCPDRKEKCYLESSFQLRKLHLNQILPFFFAGHISNDMLYSATAQPSCTHRQTNIRIVARSAVKAGEACAHDRKSIRIFRRGVTTTTSLRSRRAVDRS